MLFEVTVYGKHDEEYAQFQIVASDEREAINLGIKRYAHDDWDSVGAKRLS